MKNTIPPETWCGKPVSPAHGEGNCARAKGHDGYCCAHSFGSIGIGDDPVGFCNDCKDQTVGDPSHTSAGEVLPWKEAALATADKLTGGKLLHDAPIGGINGDDIADMFHSEPHDAPQEEWTKDFKREFGVIQSLEGVEHEHSYEWVASNIPMKLLVDYVADLLSRTAKEARVEELEWVLKTAQEIYWDKTGKLDHVGLTEEIMEKVEARAISLKESTTETT